MKILYLAHRIPYPPNKGDKIRSFNEVKHLAAHHTVDLICLADEKEDLQHEKALQQYCRNVFISSMSKTLGKIKGMASFVGGGTISVAYFYQKIVQKVFDRWLAANGYDAVICFSSPMAEYIFRSKSLNLEGKGSRKGPKLIMDFCDIDSDKWLQYAGKTSFPLKQVYGTEYRRLQAYEKKVYETFDATVVISQQEKGLFLRTCPEAQSMHVMPNGVDTDYFSPQNMPPAGKGEDGPVLVFTGAMDYHANVDGVTWFCDHVFPAVREQYKKAGFFIVGRNPAPAVHKLGSRPGVRIVGSVDDIRPWYEKADVFVVPLRLARGVQNKVLEAMAMGRAIVATPKTSSAIGAEPGKHLLVADNDDKFAAALASLLADRTKREKLGRDARNFVQKQFDWAVSLEKLENLLP